MIADFDIGMSDARRMFNNWNHSRFLAPRDLWGDQKASSRARPSFLPFYAFEMDVELEFCGAVGHRRADSINSASSASSSSSQPTPLDFRWADWTPGGRRKFSWTDPVAQVYASYRYRRDFVEAAKLSPDRAGLLPGCLRTLRHAEASSLAVASRRVSSTEPGVDLTLGGDLGDAVGDRRRDGVRATSSSRASPLPIAAAAAAPSAGLVPLDEPSMRTEIALTLALRNVRSAVTPDAEALLRDQHKADAVKNVSVRVHVRSSKARLLFLPAFFVVYQHGTKYDDVSSRIVPDRYGAVVGGLRGADIAAERHYCPIQAQVGAVGGVFGLGAAGQAASGSDMSSLFSLDMAFLGVVVAGAASLFARAGLKYARDREEERTQALDVEDFRAWAKAYDSFKIGNHRELLDDRLLLRREEGDWRRFEESGKYHWKESVRRAWAEDIYEKHAQFRKDRELHIQQQIEEQMRAAEAEARERFKRRIYGHDFASSTFGGAASDETGSARGTSDHQGFYARMSIENGPRASEEDIKAAFRRLAFDCHPDRHQLAAPEEKDRFESKFKALQEAYRVLSNAELRKLYDEGHMVEI